jgi:hypothetical protein
MPASYGHTVLRPSQHLNGGTFPQGYEDILKVNSTEAVARCLRVRLEKPSDPAPLFLGMLAGDVSGRASGAFIDTHDDYGVMKIVLGGRLARTIYADLQSGDYFLPPAEGCSVSVARWNPAGGGGPPGDITVDIEVSDANEGGVTDFRPLTCTGYGYLEAGETTSMKIPIGAYAVDVQTERGAGIGGLTDWTYAGADGPIFECDGGNVYLVRDYQTQVAMPQGIVPIVGPYQAGASTSFWSFFSVANQAAVGVHVCKAIFYVR